MIYFLFRAATGVRDNSVSFDCIARDRFFRLIAAPAIVS